MSNETRGRKRQPRLLPRGTAWLLFAVALGVYLDRLFQLMATLNVAISIGAAAPSQSHDHLPAAGASTSRREILPKRLISVFGSEASGSTFLATTLGVASGAFPVNGTVVTLPSDRFNNSGRTIVERVVSKRARSPDGAIEVQHLSLPWGWWGTKKRNCNMHHLTLTVDAFVPKACFRFDYESTWEHRMEEKAPIGCREEAHISGRRSSVDGWTCGTSNCGEGANEGYALYPRRFFVNITSHIEWYLQRGVDVTAVLSVRDKTISFVGKTSTHCSNETVAKVEEKRARSIMAESLRKYGRQGEKGNRVVVVSYETLMSLQAPYLFDTYDMLGIDSDYIPEFKDGNEKYVKAK